MKRIFVNDGLNKSRLHVNENPLLLLFNETRLENYY
jgi:hypothetical protein